MYSPLFTSLFKYLSRYTTPTTVSYIITITSQRHECFPVKLYLPINLPTYQTTYLSTCIPISLPINQLTYLSTNLPTYQPTYQPTYLSTNQPTYLSTNLPTYQPTYLSTKLPTYQSTNIPINKPTYLPINQTTYLSTNLLTYQPTYLSTFLPTYLLRTNLQMMISVKFFPRFFILIAIDLIFCFKFEIQKKDRTPSRRRKTF